MTVQTKAVNGLEVAAAEDVGNILALEHVNVTVPDQALAAQFYIVGLGLTRDPYMMVGPENMWVNVGEQQFHLPTRSPQVVPGHVGLVVRDLEALKRRLERLRERLAGTRFAWAQEDGYVAVTCPWGNRFRAYARSERFPGMATGIPYVEFLVQPGTAAGIARFYKQVMEAPATVAKGNEGPVAHVSVGLHQSLRFRETGEPQPPFDGHHIAIYIANFSGPYGFFKERGLVMQDIAMNQFRFKEIVDARTGERLHELEHEVRSLRHPMWGRELVNRDPNQSIRGYARGADALRGAA